MSNIHDLYNFAAKEYRARRNRHLILGAISNGFFEIRCIHSDWTVSSLRFGNFAAGKFPYSFQKMNSSADQILSFHNSEVFPERAKGMVSHALGIRNSDKFTLNDIFALSNPKPPLSPVRTFIPKALGSSPNVTHRPLPAESTHTYVRKAYRDDPGIR